MLKILLLEKEKHLPALERLLKEASTGLFAEVSSVFTFEKCFEFYEKFAPDLIFFGVEQNVEQSLDFCRNFLLQNSQKNTYLIALCHEKTLTEDKSRLLEAGVDFLVSYPLDLPTFRSFIRFTHKNQQQYQENLSRKQKETLEEEQKKAEKYLDHIHLRSMALQQVSNGVIITNKEGLILWANDAYCAMTGYPLRELIGETPQILESGKQDKKFYEQMWKTLKSGQVWQGEFINKKKNGEFYYEEATLTPLYDKNGDLEYYVGVKQDITKRKLNEQALEESEAKLKALFASTNKVYILLNSDFEITFYNEKAETLSPYLFKEKITLGQSVFDLVPEEDLIQYKHQLVLTRYGEKILFDKEIQINGSSHWFEIIFSPIERDKQVVQIVLQYYDITERVLERMKSEEQNAFLETLIDTIPSPIYYKDKLGHYTGCNDAFADFVGFQKEEIIGKTVYDLAPRELAEIYDRSDRKLFKIPGVHIYEGQALNHAGEMKTFIFNKATFTDRKNELAGLIGVMLDVSDMKQLQKELIAAKEKYEELINNLEVGIFRFLPEAAERIVEANPAMLEMLGLNDKHGLKEIRLENLFFEKFQFLRFIQLIKEKGSVRGYEMLLQSRRKQGLLWTSITAVSKRDGSGKLYVDGIMEDISERKDHEQKIKHRMNLERLISEISSSFVDFVDFEETIQRALERMGEYSNSARVYIFEFHQNNKYARSIYAWGASGLSTAQDELQQLETAKYKWWMEHMNANQIIWLQNIKDLPPSAQAERILLEHREVVSVIAIPFFADNNLIGFLGFDSINHAINWSIDDGDLLRVFAQMIGNAYQRQMSQVKLKKYTQQIETDLGIKLDSLKKAQIIQKDLNIEDLPVQPKIDISSFYMPLESLGGDYFDLKELDHNKIAIIMADCTGHGIEAALYSVIVKSLADRYYYLLEQGETDIFLGEINNATIDYFQGYNFFTMFVGILDTRTKTFIYSNANGETPFILGQRGIEKTPPAKGFYVGYNKDQFYEKVVIPIAAGDRLFFYSDALKEIRLHNSCLGSDGIKEILKSIPWEKYELSYIFDKIEIINQFFPYDDDLTAVMLEYKEPYRNVVEIEDETEARNLRLNLETTLKGYNYSEFDTQSLVVVFDEITSNGIIHGNKMEPGKKLKVEICVNYIF